LFTRLLAALALFVMLGCGPQAPCWTSAHPDEGYMDLITGAVQLVHDKFPEWYDEKVVLTLDLENTEDLAYTTRNKEGTTFIKLTQKTLNLCTEEDVASVILHESVHAKLWDEIEALVPDPDVCNHIRHELTANLTVAFAYYELEYGPEMLGMALDLYEHNYLEALLECNKEIYGDMPMPAASVIIR